MNTVKPCRKYLLLVGLVALFAAPPLYAGKLKVSGADPSFAEQGTIEQSVDVSGDGFDDGSEVRFLVSGSRNDTGGVSTSPAEYVGPRLLRVRVTVDAEARLGDYDIEVRTSSGRRGKGNTLFKVVEPGGNPYSGESLSLDCQLVSAESDTILSDGRPGPDGEGSYVDGEEKANCDTGGTVQPNLSGLNLGSLWNGKRILRKIDLAFDNFLGADGETTSPPLQYLPAGIFEEAESWSEMENVSISVRPYRFDQDHIQLLAPGFVYPMAVRIRITSTAEYRFFVNLAGSFVAGDSKWEGLRCDVDALPDPHGWTAAEVAEVSNDVNVYLWPDTNGDFVTDGFTVTTGEIVVDPPRGGYSLANPPVTSQRPLVAAICSSEGPLDCAGADNSDVCNFLGFVDAQFTWHAEVRD